MAKPDPTRDSTGAAADDNYHTESHYVTLTLEEVASLLIIASTVNPEDYVSNEARAVIYKARAVITTRGDTSTFTGTISVTSQNARRGW